MGRSTAAQLRRKRGNMPISDDSIPFGAPISIAPDPEATQKKLALALGTAATIETNDLRQCVPGRSAFIFGMTGRGKTVLAANLARLSGISFTAIRTADLLAEVRATWKGKGREEDVISKYRHARYLILDDFGVPAPGTDALFRIVDYREAESLPTVFTSNLSLDEIALTMDDRLASRIASLCAGHIVRLIGPDRRVKA